MNAEMNGFRSHIASTPLGSHLSLLWVLAGQSGPELLRDQHAKTSSNNYFMNFNKVLKIPLKGYNHGYPPGIQGYIFPEEKAFRNGRFAHSNSPVSISPVIRENPTQITMTHEIIHNKINSKIG